MSFAERQTILGLPLIASVGVGRRACAPSFCKKKKRCIKVLGNMLAAPAAEGDLGAAGGLAGVLGTFSLLGDLAVAGGHRHFSSA